MALANSGFVQVELIQTRNDVPSMYRDFLQAGRTGLQHVAYWTSDYDADLKRLLTQGFKPKMQGEVGERGRFIYFDTEFHPGTVIELSEVAGPKGRMFDLIRESSRSWDGITDPVRPFPDLTTL
ncbi:Glyoxalase/Bleomycin resistance protein/Dioxygenase superfamily protein [compost metagenome]